MLGTNSKPIVDMPLPIEDYPKIYDRNKNSIFFTFDVSSFHETENWLNSTKDVDNQKDSLPPHSYTVHRPDLHVRRNEAGKPFAVPEYGFELSSRIPPDI